VKYLIIGGTGTLGQELIKQIVETKEFSFIRVFSRCELKQKEVKARFNHPDIQFILGDIRDYQSVYQAMEGVRYVFHVAALKHIDILESNPEESVKTNILGTVNVANAAEARNVYRVVFSSTDKAVNPINVYGMSKGISERVLFNRRQQFTKYFIYRWGNVLGSRGSLLETLQKTIASGKPIELTNPEMTRFWINIEDAVKFILNSYYIDNKKILIPPLKASKVTRLIESYLRVHGIEDYPINVVGARPGEKVHEDMDGHINSNSHLAPQYTNDELDSMVLKAMGTGKIMARQNIIYCNHEWVKRRDAHGFDDADINHWHDYCQACGLAREEK